MCDVFPGLPSTPMSAVARIWEELDFSAIDKQDKQITNVLQKNMFSGVTWAGVGLQGGNLLLSGYSNAKENFRNKVVFPIILINEIISSCRVYG